MAGFLRENLSAREADPFITAQVKMVEGGGFEPPKASPTDLQSVPFSHSGTPPEHGTDEMNLLFTSAVTCAPSIFCYFLELAMGLEPATC